MVSIQSKGLLAPYTLSQPSATSRRSATNSMYCDISSWFMPISATGSAWHTNSFSIATPSVTICVSRAGSSLCFRCLQEPWWASEASLPELLWAAAASTAAGC